MKGTSRANQLYLDPVGTSGPNAVAVDDTNTFIYDYQIWPRPALIQPTEEVTGSHDSHTHINRAVRGLLAIP